MKTKHLVFVFLITFVAAAFIVSSVKACVINPPDPPDAGVKREKGCCQEDGCGMGTGEGCVKYDTGQCPEKCSVIAKLPEFAPAPPAGTTAQSYFQTSGDGTYQACFSGSGTIYRLVSGNWVNLGGAYIGASGQTCLYGLSGDGVYAFVP